MKIDLMKKLCSMNTKKLYSTILKFLKTQGYTNIRATNMYIVAEGKLPICLVAHMDTVFPAPPTEFFYDQEKTTLWSPSGLGADDRAGIYIILNLIANGFRPTVIFTDLEEKGGIGADALIRKYPNCPIEGCKALIQLDRQGMKDAVYYDCNNKDFEKKISSYGFVTDWGTFSDISVIAPQWGIAAVNLSVGYEREHTYTEILNTSDCDATMYKVQSMLKDCIHWPKYKYIPAPPQFFLGGKEPWWSANKCEYCGRRLNTNQGRVVGDQAKPEEMMLLCDDCYEYFSNKELF